MELFPLAKMLMRSYGNSFNICAVCSKIKLISYDKFNTFYAVSHKKIAEIGLNAVFEFGRILWIDSQKTG